MDNIFDGSTTAAVMNTGIVLGSELQYNLFFNDAAQTVGNANLGPPLPAVENDQPINGDPKFVDPTASYPNRPNFQLQAGSAAIDAGRSELSLDPNALGYYITTLVPIATQVLDDDGTGGIRNANNRNPDIGLTFGFGGASIPPPTTLALPGYPSRGFVDQWEMVANPATATGSAATATVDNGPSSDAATNVFIPYPGGGQRDQNGTLRQDDPGVPNVGFGDSPYFDVGAFEFVQYNPPEVTPFANGQNVIATLPNGTGRDIYSVGGDRRHERDADDDPVPLQPRARPDDDHQPDGHAPGVGRRGHLRHRRLQDDQPVAGPALVQRDDRRPDDQPGRPDPAQRRVPAHARRAAART